MGDIDIDALEQHSCNLDMEAIESVVTGFLP